MDRLKKLGVCVALLGVLSAAAVLLFWDLGTACLSVLTSGVGEGEYLLTASDAEGNLYALGRTEENFRLVVGDPSGRRSERWTLREGLLPPNSIPATLYPAAGGAVYLGLYHTAEHETKLQLYRLTDRGRKAELLLEETCPGENLQEQMANTRLSDFSEVDSVVTFALLQGDTAQFYQRTSSGSGLEERQKITQPDLQAALALSDGTLVLATGDHLLRTDGRSVALAQGEKIQKLIPAGTGVYYVDGSGLRIYFAEFADWQPYAFLELEKEAYDLDSCTDLWVTRDGDVLLLMDGQNLLLDRGSTVPDLTEMLYQTPVQCVLILAGLALAVLALTALLWFLLWEQRRLRLPMLVRWGVLTAVVAAVGTGFLVRGIVYPVSQETTAQGAYHLLGSVASQTLQTLELTDESLTQRLGNSLAQAGEGPYRDAAVSVYRHNEENTWTLLQSNTGLERGTRAELSPGFDRIQVERTPEGTFQFWSQCRGDTPHYLLYQRQGELLLSVDVAGAALLAAGYDDCRWMIQGLSALAVLLTALMLAILCRITLGLRRALHGMERLAAGEREVHVMVGGGDELASLAEDVNALSDALQDVDRQQRELAQSYRRFVPERVLSLLGKTSILEVDKQTFVSRHLATMTIWFRFPAQVYEKSGRELFDNINEILERTASLVTQKGGAVFNFAYNGYDAVFEGGSAAAVSTAVAVEQEILDLNRQREDAGLPTVRVHIALDEGNVMLGVVGDKNQIEPTSISSSFTVVKHLIALCRRLDANILCTEAVIGGAKDYGSRYMGKCMEADQAIRTYEIFEGDPYDIRKVKENTGDIFSQGVYALYNLEFSKAKGIFLKLVHHNTGDGGARYYLYLADRLEKRPEETITLDAGIDRE